MDVSAKEIVFDANICNFCRQATESLSQVREERAGLGAKLLEIRMKHENNDYDCLIGLSGGVDSSYMLMKAVELGLRPYCFSIDNGYNKPEADENIMRLVEGLKVPFYRYNIDLTKFKRLQSAFMHAGVPNIEIPTDHLLMAASYEIAARYGIETILSGGNVATESIMPASWGANARDLTHIKAIYRKFAKEKLSGLPLCSLLKWNWYRWVKKISHVYLLDYLDYNRTKAEQKLIEKFGFKSTGEKHEENYFTWWFQNYYLFEKFGIDKRKAHYSSMVVSGQMTRAEALAKLESNPIYPKLGIEEKVMKYKRHQHNEYPMDKWYGRIAKLMKYVGA